jgi:hypothetical protein
MYGRPNVGSLLRCLRFQACTELLAPRFRFLLEALRLDLLVLDDNMLAACA